MVDERGSPQVGQIIDLAYWFTTNRLGLEPRLKIYPYSGSRIAESGWTYRGGDALRRVV